VVSQAEVSSAAIGIPAYCSATLAVYLSMCLLSGAQIPAEEMQSQFKLAQCLSTCTNLN
jgi:hypothetical protein